MHHITVTTPATAEPLSIEECRAQNRAYEDEEDPDLIRFLASARARVERFTGLRLMSQTVVLTLDDFGSCEGYGDVTPLPVAPIQNVDQVRYMSAADVWTVLDPAEYRLMKTTHPISLLPAYSKAWPVVLDYPGAVEITLTVGYGDEPADVPDDLRTAVAMLVAHYDHYREAGVEGATVSELPNGVLDILTSWQQFV